MLEHLNVSTSTFLPLIKFEQLHTIRGTTSLNACSTSSLVRVIRPFQTPCSRSLSQSYVRRSIFDHGFKVDISAHHPKLDDRGHLGPIKLTLGLPLELSQNTLDAGFIAELTTLQLDLEHALSCTIDKHTPCLYALARADLLQGELGSGLLALVQGRVDSGSSGIDNSEHNPLAKPLPRLGIIEGIMY